MTDKTSLSGRSPEDALRSLSHEIQRLRRDAAHLKLLVYTLFVVIALLVSGAWKMYFHLDNRLDDKVTKVNERIDEALIRRPGGGQIDVVKDILGPLQSFMGKGQ